jgi:hypothetical protein
VGGGETKVGRKGGEGDGGGGGEWHISVSAPHLQAGRQIPLTTLAAISTAPHSTPIPHALAHSSHRTRMQLSQHSGAPDSPAAGGQQADFLAAVGAVAAQRAVAVGAEP